MRLLIACLFLFPYASCSNDVPIVDDELQIYFDRFEEEGKKRGIEINLELSAIGGSIENIPTNGVSGSCVTYSDGSKEVIIDNRFWQGYSDLKKESVVFHELGHCFLNRDHLDVEDAFGNCVSIMHSGEEQCNFIYNTDTRSSFLDELFEF